MRRFQSFTQGLVLTAVATAISLAVTLYGFRRTYYLAQMLPIFMAFYVLLAWLVYLKKTSFQGYRPDATQGTATEIPEDKISGAELLGNRDENGLVARRPTLRDNRVEGFLENPVPALLWSACQLALLASALYKFFGIGATYY